AMPYLLIELASTIGLPLLTVATAWLLGYLVPQIEIMTARAKWLLPGLAGATAIILMVTAAAHNDYDASHPRADSVAYLLDADTGRAAWVSADRAPDSWTSQFLKGRLVSTKLRD